MWNPEYAQKYEDEMREKTRAANAAAALASAESDRDRARQALRNSAAETSRMDQRCHAAESLLRAVLLFHSGGPWTPKKSNEWFNATQAEEATSRTLCNAIRAHLAGEQINAGIHHD